MKAKSPQSSSTTKTEVVCSNHTNPIGLLLGGHLVEWMDIAAAVCAQRHAGQICVTVSINTVNFKSSARVGDIVQVVAVITRAFNSSMEILVEATATNVISGNTYKISSAYFTFVALDDHGKVTTVPPVAPKSSTEKLLYEGALKRRKQATNI